MCGIIAFACKEPTKLEIDLLKRLMEESKIRGLHAFGTAFFDKKGGFLVTHKSLKLDIDFLLDKFKGGNLIFHSRYSTCGDWKCQDNNQPITLGSSAIVMNGVLTQERKEVFERIYRVTCWSDNDAEIFLRKMEEGIDIKDFLEAEEECSFAGAILTDSEFFVIRNNKRPLYTFRYGKAMFAVSTRDIARRAGIEEVKPVPVLQKVSMI